MNYKKAAPLLFCAAVDDHPEVRKLKDATLIEELIKTKAVATLLKFNIDAGSADVDIIEFAIATRMLE